MDIADCEKWWTNLSAEMKRYIHATSTTVDLTLNRGMWVQVIEKLHQERLDWEQGKRRKPPPLARLDSTESDVEHAVATPGAEEATR